ncbi:CubicO group peptidase, beta-lactamase class C family [Roseomonas rosea]|uniref:CubicO group peptidase, beta-lactamase class C family n=1 Tax=Muricoccus roseus TaxID=198092 RepID=A0A1M6PFL8_9PROT|nr:serine hydrolase [Roseomonas rosea]SHK06743.1 CubicO group peptidase, beta-lactamase class C family [Roseomonas rosea]
MHDPLLRRRALPRLGVGLMAAPASAAPGTEGFAPDLEEKLAAGLRSGLLPGLHALLVARHGQVVLAHYGQGPDESWGRPLGEVRSGPEVPHDLRSVTKSVVGLLYGIALARGAVPPPEAPLLAQFPEYPDLAADPARQALRVSDALDMTMGLAWDESRPYTDPANSEIAMENAADRYRYVLEQPVEHPRGTRWTYSGGAVALLGALIARGTGQSLPDFAQAALFEPLGFESGGWAAGRDGVPSAASGLRLTAPALLRIGEMVLAGGAWEGRRVVPEAWLAAMTRPAVPTGDGLHYSRLWYLGGGYVPGLGGPRPWLGAFGNGGQRLYLMPAAGLAMACFCGLYNRPEQAATPLRIWREIVLANLVRG